MSGDRDTALAFMEALWAGDLDRCDRLLAADARWFFQLGMPQAEAGGRVQPARDAMRQLVDDLFTRFDPEGFAVDVTRVIGDEGAIAIEYEARGRTGRGRAYENHYVTVLVMRGGSVAEVRPYNDTRHMLELLNDEPLSRVRTSPPPRRRRGGADRGR